MSLSFAVPSIVSSRVFWTFFGLPLPRLAAGGDEEASAARFVPFGPGEALWEDLVDAIVSVERASAINQRLYLLGVFKSEMQYHDDYVVHIESEHEE